MAVASLVLSLIGLLLAGPILGTLAVIFGITAQQAISKEPSTQGQGLATTGIVIGIIDIFFGIWLFVALTT